MQQANNYISSSNSRHGRTFDENCCCICKNTENSEMFAKDFIPNRYYVSFLFSAFFLKDD